MPPFQQIPLAFPFNPAMDEDSFYISKSNQFAADIVKKWPDWQGENYIIYGDEGAGKTHLLNIWVKHSNAVLLDNILLEKGFDYISKEYKLDGTAIAIDDVHILSLSAQQCLFHILNYLGNLAANNTQKTDILLTSTMLAGQFENYYPDLKSRLAKFVQVEITHPDDALLSEFLLKNLQDKQLFIAPDIGDYILKNAPRDFKKILTLIDEIDTASLAGKKQISKALVRQILNEQPE